MTDDIKATRLSKAAREFNVGISTIVEFLHKKGFKLDPNPNEKLPPEAYALLIKEYSTDISVKKESEKLILKDLHRRKESVSIEDVAEKSPSEESEGEDEILIKDASGTKKTIEIKPEIKKPDIKLVGKIDLEKAGKPKPEKAEPEKELIETKPVKETKTAVTGEKKEKAAEKKPPKEKEEEKKTKSSIVIVGKIDLDSVTKDPKPSRDEDTKSAAKEKEEDNKHKPEKKHVPEPVAEVEPVAEIP
jgi:translation initiation factor IF-2